METTDYARIFSDVKDELQSLQDQKVILETDLADLNAKVEAMTKTYNALAPLIGETPIPGPDDWLATDNPLNLETLKAAGITAAVRAVIEAVPCEHGAVKGMTVAMVRDRLQDIGWDWERYTNPLATVNTVLKRLSDNGAIDLDPKQKDGARTFSRKLRDFEDVPF
jgi:hypothetical protein